MKQPVILVTCYRRYWELKQTLEHIDSLKSEFQVKPEIVVIWSCPELGRLWFFQELLKEGKIQHLIYRDATKHDGGGPTTHTASLNIRKGLNFVKSQYKSGFFVICNDADILVVPGHFRWIEKEMNNGKHGILFFWFNGIRNENIWHTNFFAVDEQEKNWPPLSEFGHADVLEAQWGNSLIKIGLDNFIITHNSRNQKFTDTSVPGNLPDFPWKPQHEESGVFLYIRGYIPWYIRLFRYFRSFIYG